MPQLRIHTHLPSATALRLALPDAGHFEVTPTAEQLAALGSAERQALADYVSITGETPMPRKLLYVDCPGWDGVVQALASELQKARDEQAAIAANVERERESYRQILTLAAVGGYYEDGLPLHERDFGGVFRCWAPSYGKGDPEAEALWAEIEKAKAADRATRILAADAELGDQHLDAEGNLADAVTLVLQACRLWKGGRYVEDPAPPNAIALRERARALRAELAAAREAAAAAEVTAWITEHAPALLPRHLAGVLPESELLEALRAEAFEPAADLARYQKITAGEVQHFEECGEAIPEFRVEPARALTAAEFEVLLGLRQAFGDGYTVEADEHRAWCAACNGDEDSALDVVRRSARVSCVRLGRPLSRRYAL